MSSTPSGRTASPTGPWCGFFSDNGAAQWGSNGPQRGLKATDWEAAAGCRPSGSGRSASPPGTESHQLASTLDVMPTLLSLVGPGAAPSRSAGALRGGPWRLVIDRHDGTPGAPDAVPPRRGRGGQDLAGGPPGPGRAHARSHRGMARGRPGALSNGSTRALSEAQTPTPSAWRWKWWL